jgi:general secretion pathway protein G
MLRYRKKEYKRVKRGFSLMEIMVVIIILGLLAAVVMPNLVGKSEEAKRDIVCIQMKTIADSINMFKLDNGIYPETEDGIKALYENPSEEKYPNYSSKAYMEKGSKLLDPWKREFVYLNNDGSFEIISLGADGKEGGKDEASDIKYSECK